MENIMAAHISEFLAKPLKGSSLPIIKPADLKDCGFGDLVWIKSFSNDRLSIIERNRPSLVICDSNTFEQTSVPSILSENPRLDFIKVLNRFFAPDKSTIIHTTAIMEEGVRIGKDVSIGAYTHIGKQAIIGDNCTIGSGVSIEGAVTLGNRCVVKANSALGGQGFGFEYNDEGEPIHFPHLGCIIIGDDVWIGSCTTVEIGTLGATHINNGCKIDDLIQIGHNVVLGENTLVMANTVLCGGCIIGKKCWIAPNCVIKEKVRIGDNVTVGLGSVVIRDVDNNVIVAGVPAKKLRNKE